MSGLINGMHPDRARMLGLVPPPSSNGASNPNDKTNFSSPPTSTNNNIAPQPQSNLVQGMHPSRAASLGIKVPPQPEQHVSSSSSSSHRSERRRSDRDERRSDRRDSRHSSSRRDRDRDGERERRDRDRHSRRRSRSRGSSSKSGVRRTPSRYWDQIPPNAEGLTAEQYKDKLLNGVIHPQDMVTLFPGLVYPFRGMQAPSSGAPTLTMPKYLPSTGAVIPNGTGQTKEPSSTAAIMTGGLPISCIPSLGMLPVGPDPHQGTMLGRTQRRLYCGNIPYGTSEQSLYDFFNQLMISKGLTIKAGEPVIAVQVNHEKFFAFLEFRSPEETTCGLGLDGVSFSGQVLKTRRPRDYTAAPGSENLVVPHVKGIISSHVAEGDNKIYIGRLPEHFSDNEVKELVSLYGELKAFSLVKDNITGISKGYAFLEYLVPANTAPAVQGLNGMSVGDKTLLVQCAGVNGSHPQAQAAPVDPSLKAMGINMENVQATQVLVLMNMIDVSELIEDDDYEDLKADIIEELQKYGTVVACKIPRPSSFSADKVVVDENGQEKVVRGEEEEVPGLGKVFIQYSTIDEASNAQTHTAGRKFSDKTIVTSFISLEHFNSGTLS